MRNNIFNNIKVRKPFEVIDIFIYLFLLIVVFVLFLCFVILPHLESAEGFLIAKNGNTIVNFDYSSGKYSVDSEFKKLVVVDENSCTITVYTNEQKSEYNVIVFDREKKVVKMLDSTCSSTKDCIYEPEISVNGMIFCAPHDLKVLPLNDNFSPTSPVIGGGR